MRTTDRHVNLALSEFTNLLSSEVGRPVAVTLHRGNGTHKIHNVLIVDNTNLWNMGTGGCTTTDAWKALRTMTAAIGAVSDIREGDRLRDRRVLRSFMQGSGVPDWDTETTAYSLSDCKHWDKPGTECAGPRVGKTRDGVILCERHYNSTGA